jgi:hypothetical protein
LSWSSSALAPALPHAVVALLSRSAAGGVGGEAMVGSCYSWRRFAVEEDSARELPRVAWEERVQGRGVVDLGTEEHRRLQLSTNGM